MKARGNGIYEASIQNACDHRVIAVRSMEIAVYGIHPGGSVMPSQSRAMIPVRRN